GSGRHDERLQVIGNGRAADDVASRRFTASPHTLHAMLLGKDLGDLLLDGDYQQLTIIAVCVHGEFRGVGHRRHRGRSSFFDHQPPAPFGAPVGCMVLLARPARKSENSGAPSWEKQSSFTGPYRSKDAMSRGGTR